MIDQCSNAIYRVSGSGISTEQQKKTWLINWYFANDPMGSIYLATLRNPALVASYQTSPGMLYGANGAAGMETYFIKIKTHFGQSMFDQLVTEFPQQSNLYVDEIKVDEFHMYGSSRLGVYESNKLISKRVARDLNLDNQISTNEYVIETPEEVTYLFSSYQLERGAKRYELANHLGNVLTVISDKKTAICTGNTFNYFAAERISATDYSPFGAPLASRTWQASEYRFGFNGKENDSQLNGFGRCFAYEARIYETNLGRWFSVDPLQMKFPNLSPYLNSENNPIYFMDNDGREPNRSQAANWKEVKAVLTNYFSKNPENQSLHKLKYTEGAGGGGGQVGPFGGEKGPRYIYTEKYGWIDLGHFFQVAAELDKAASKGGKFGKWLAQNLRDVYVSAKIALVFKTAEVENGQKEGSETQWSYEDAPSNNAGLDFWFLYLTGNKNIVEDLEKFFEDAGAKDPKEAPNYPVMQDKPQKTRWFEQNKTFTPNKNPKPTKDNKKANAKDSSEKSKNTKS